MRDQSHGANLTRRLVRSFSLTGSLMWCTAVFFVGLAFSQEPGQNDWVLMHYQKIDIGIGLGVAAIGTLFLCFAALIAVSGPRRD